MNPEQQAILAAGLVRFMEGNYHFLDVNDGRFVLDGEMQLTTEEQAVVLAVLGGDGARWYHARFPA